MSGELPEYYFRIRDNGAVVFRVDTENRQRRIDMEEDLVCTSNFTNCRNISHRTNFVVYHHK